MTAPPANERRHSETVADGLPRPLRYWAVFGLSLAVVMAVLDSTVINIALPAIAQDLGISAASSVWVVNAYQLVVAVSLLPLASLGEIIGYRRVFMGGAVVFTLASLICATTDSLSTLIGARILQGLGGAGVMSVVPALVRFIYPRHRLGRGIGINALVVASSATLGPTVAAGILSLAEWPWLFAINVPLGLLSVLVSMRTLPQTPRSARRFDLISATLNVLTLGLLIIGIDGLGHGQRMGLALMELAAAAVLGYVLVRRQLSLPSPLLPVDLLRTRIFALSIGTSICSFTAQLLAFVSLPFYLHEMGKSAVEIGLLMTPWPLMVVVTAPIAGRLADRYAAGLLGAVGLAVLTLGLLSLALLPAQPSGADIIWRMALCGIGFGIFQSPNNRTIMNSAPRSRSGGASGMLATARLLGQTLGAALAATMFNLLPEQGKTAALALAASFALAAALTSSLRLISRDTA
jgi:DHA2 family multidrug resistance protein-like MFS transporter